MHFMATWMRGLTAYEFISTTQEHGRTGCKSRLWASTEETGILRSVPESANTAARLRLRELLSRVSLLTGSAGGVIFSTPNRWMAIACGWTTMKGSAGVGQTY